MSPSTAVFHGSSSSNSVTNKSVQDKSTNYSLDTQTIKFIQDLLIKNVSDFIGFLDNFILWLNKTIKSLFFFYIKIRQNK